MPKRTDIHKILIVGAGPIIIGQACEFDYSGTQACKALKEEGYEVVLVNSNPATIMTDPSMADSTYIEPLTVEVVAKIIEKERPDAILPTVGGQTGLNLSLDLHREGVLDKYNVEMIGAKPDVIHKAEARDAFKKAMQNIGLELARSEVAYTLEEAKANSLKIGYPLVIRPAFTLGGTGGGIAHDEKEMLEIVEQGLMNSLISEVLIEESIVGWKEYELEVMRDKNDNVVIVCSIENIDAMGVHTGDSVTVAPAQTLTDKEYQVLRNASIDIMREIGVDTGGSNVQFAVNPKDGRVIVIEMNPRVSRSSALASKATGFPIAKFAAKLSVGYTLDELNNDITKKTPACFEPALDYVVTKIPRFDTRKFSKEAITLGTSMKSVGEAMSIGRTFKESFQKGLRSLELNRFGLGYDGKDITSLSEQELKAGLIKPTPDRIHIVKYALEKGMSIEDVYELSGIDPWFLYQFKQIIEYSQKIDINDADELREAKRLGFSDHQLAHLTGVSSESEIREKRKELGVIPTYSLVDTCAAEFEAYTPYYYSTYETQDERRPSTKKKVMILGGGPNRIGQGIEFDYCCVHSSFALREEDFESIMVNSNPETVSTDFDISDKLFFEPLTFEDVLNIYEVEKPEGVIVQFGGQTPLNLSTKLEASGVKVLGTSSDSIDRTEDRERCVELLKLCGLQQAPNGTATSMEGALDIANSIGYPVVVRPSYVIGGTSMKIVYNDEEISSYMVNTPEISDDRPVLVDKFLDHAIECDVDCISDGHDAIVIGILEHIEPCGVHSGDSACVFPPHSLSQEIQDEMRTAARRLAKELSVKGLLNIQFAVKDNQLYVIEINPRASRTVPFISKAAGVPWIKMATKIIMGKTIRDLKLKEVIPSHYAIKESVFPFNRFDTTDILLGPEMKSTGEVMGIDTSLSNSFIKSQLATRQSASEKPNSLFVTAEDRYKPLIINAVKRLSSAGVNLFATKGTQKFLKENGLESTLVSKIADKTDGSSIDVIKNGNIDLVFNLTSNLDDKDEKMMRRASLAHQVPFISTVEAFNMFVDSVLDDSLSIDVRSIQSYYSDIPELEEVLN